MQIDLQIAVAKAMGWKSHPDEYYIDKLAWTLKDDPQRWATCDLPPITLDLMWEAEEMLKGDDEGRYIDELSHLVSSDRSHKWHAFKILHATAEQRAKAWLKVKGVNL